VWVVPRGLCCTGSSIWGPLVWGLGVVGCLQVHCRLMGQAVAKAHLMDFEDQGQVRLEPVRV
jgi:hypothetical protein